MSKAWPHASISSVAKQIERLESPQSGKTYRQIGVRLWGQGAYERESIDGSETKYKTLNQVKAGDIIVNKIWARNGSVSIVSSGLEGCYCSGEFPIFEPIPTLLDSQWFYWITKTRWFWEKCDAQSRGTSGKNRIRPEKFMAIEIPLPPLAEQQRIVAKIERLAGKIEEASNLRQKSIKEVKTAIDNEVRYIFTKLPNRSWEEGLLGNYILEDCYGTSNKTNDDPSGTPILRMGNIQNGILDIRDIKYLHIDKKDRSKWILHNNDIVVNRTNSAELVGKCAVFNLKGDWGFASYLIRLRLDTNRANPWLVATYINSPLGREYMFRERKQMTGQANVNSKKIRALPITLPPIETQNRIVQYLEELRKNFNKVTTIQAQSTTELDALLPSILDKAFKGEL